jgi:hypothetical protein
VLRSITVIAVFLAVAVRARAGGETLIGRAEGKSFAVTVTDEALKKTPSWDKAAQNPPLSARKAIELASDLKNALVKDADGWKWKLAGLCLKESDPKSTSDKWYWLAYFEAWPTKGGLGGVPPHLYFFVLMDGRVIEPVVRNDR